MVVFYLQKRNLLNYAYANIKYRKLSGYLHNNNTNNFSNIKKVQMVAIFGSGILYLLIRR